ncbi:MAG TPA: DUF937 domain-containing protein [Gemmatimonadaceae bacterium]
MAGIIDLIRQQITPETIDQISSEIGEDPARTRQAVDASVPLLAGAVSTQVPDAAHGTGDAAAQPAMFGGLGDMISGAGGQGGAGGIGGAIGGMLGGGAAGGMLDSILGGSHKSVQNDVSKASGIEPQKVMRILTMLAPIVFAAYTKHRQGSAPSTGKSTQAGGGVIGDIIDRIT